MLNLKNDETKFMRFISKHKALQIEHITLCVGDINITTVHTVRNLGVICDAALTMEQYVNNICTKSYQHGPNILHIRRYLTSDVIK